MQALVLAVFISVHCCVAAGPTWSVCCRTAGSILEGKKGTGEVKKKQTIYYKQIQNVLCSYASTEHQTNSAT